MAHIPHHYQLDLPYADSTFMNIPKFMPGRINTDDFVFFKWPRGFPSNLYDVLIEPADTAGSRFRTLGMLTDRVPLPSVYFNAESRIGIIPKLNPQLPRFWGRLNRASTYVIPDVDIKSGGEWALDRHGMLTGAVESYKLV